MTKTTVNTDLLQVLQILTQLVVQVVGEELRVLAVLAILLTIEEPVGNLVVLRILHNVDNALELGLVQLTGALVQVYLSLTADKACVATTATLNGGQGEHNLLTSINVSVEETKNVLETALLGYVYRLHAEERHGWMDG